MHVPCVEVSSEPNRENEHVIQIILKTKVKISFILQKA